MVEISYLSKSTVVFLNGLRCVTFIHDFTKYFVSDLWLLGGWLEESIRIHSGDVQITTQITRLTQCRFVVILLQAVKTTRIFNRSWIPVNKRPAKASLLGKKTVSNFTRCGHDHKPTHFLSSYPSYTVNTRSVNPVFCVVKFKCIPNWETR